MIENEKARLKKNVGVLYRKEKGTEGSSQKIPATKLLQYETDRPTLLKYLNKGNEKTLYI